MSSMSSLHLSVKQDLQALELMGVKIFTVSSLMCGQLLQLCT